MNKHELRKTFAVSERRLLHALRCERAIIEALPSRLDVERVIPPRKLEQSDSGGVTLKVADIAEALTLGDKYPNFKPIALSQVSARRVPTKETTSFMPSCRVPMRWHNDPDSSTSVREVYPILFQLAPSDDPLRPKVFLEWFAELAPDIIVSVRAILRNHPVMWVRRGTLSQERYEWPGIPAADYGRVLQMDKGRPPYVTLWWSKGVGHQPFASLGDGKGVARD